MKILYGVPGEGMGHATRAKVILSHLVQSHDVRIVASDRAFKFLETHFGDRVFEIEGFHIGFKDGAVSKVETTKITLKSAPKNIRQNIKRFREIHASFQPDLVISDFESFSYYFAKTHRLPVISIDNMQIIDRGRLNGITIPAEEKSNFKVAKSIVKGKVPGCDQYLISTFFDVELKKKNSQLIPPIIRNKILKAKTARKDHILVYQSSYGRNGILKLLHSMPNEMFLLYGFNVEESHGNVQMKKFSEDEFIAHFASAKAVIANGGYSFISEAVYLKKPVCSIPIKNQFEQYLNAAYIENMGYGRCLPDFNPDGVKSFLYDLGLYHKALDQRKQKGNAELFKLIDQALEKILADLY